MDDKEVLQDAEAILDAALSTVNEESFEVQVGRLREMLPGITHRQAVSTLHNTVVNMKMLAEQSGMSHGMFTHIMGPQFLIMVTGYQAGAVTQHDIENNLNPETGEPLQGGAS